MALWEEHSDPVLYEMLVNKKTQAQLAKALAEIVDEGTTDTEVKAVAASIFEHRQEWETAALKKWVAELRLDVKEAETKAGAQQAKEEEWRKNRIAGRAKFFGMSAKELHEFITDYHWDESEMVEVLRAVLDAPNCAKGTALLMYWQLECFWSIKETGFKRAHRYPQDPEAQQRESMKEGFGLEIVGRVVCNAFVDNSIPFDLVKYLSDTASRVKADTEFVKEKIRPHFPRCMTHTKYDGSATW